MKKIKLVIGLFVLFITFQNQAQAVVNINYGPPPIWAPKAPAAVQYYYLPDIGTYYDVPHKSYVYQNRGVWVRTKALPARYRVYDLYHSRPVYLTNYRGNTPYVYYKQHKVKYKGNGNWKQNGHDNGHHKGGSWKKEHHKGPKK